MREFKLNMMDYVLKMMDFVLKMMDFVLKTMDFAQTCEEENPEGEWDDEALLEAEVEYEAILHAEEERIKMEKIRELFDHVRECHHRLT